MFMTDLFLNNVVYAQYIPEGQSFVLLTGGGLWIYGGIVLTILVGFALLKKVNVPNVVVGTLVSSLIFFALTNFGVWFGSTLYPDNMAGLGACFAAGLPYLLNSILGNLFYGGILFGGFYALNKVLYPTPA